MKPFTDTLRGKLLDHRPRMTSDDQVVLDMPEEDHVAEVVNSLYQIPRWEVLNNVKELYRRARHGPPSYGSVDINGPGS